VNRLPRPDSLSQVIHAPSSEASFLRKVQAEARAFVTARGVRVEIWERPWKNRGRRKKILPFSSPLSPIYFFW